MAEEIPAKFIEAFALKPQEVTALAEKISKVFFFEPMHILALKRRVGDDDFDKTMLFKIYNHENATSFLLACSDLAYLARVEITRPALENLLADSTFWMVYHNSPTSKDRELDKSAVLRAYIRGAYHEAMERRCQSASSERITRGFTKAEMYPPGSKWARQALMENGDAEIGLG